MSSLRRVWAFITSLGAGFIYRFKYEEPIDWKKTYVVCPNHTSNLDISAMCILVSSSCSFIGKEELTRGLVTSLFFKSLDIPVNRESNISSYRAFKKAAERLQNGITMVIFPEAGIADDYPPKLQSFKNGPFRLAIEQKIPIIPITITNTWQMLWDDGTKYGSKPGICNVFVHKPIETENMVIADASTLRDNVHDIIKRKFEKV